MLVAIIMCGDGYLDLLTSIIHMYHPSLHICINIRLAYRHSFVIL